MDEYRRFKAFRKLSKARPYLDIFEGVTCVKAAETPEVAAEEPGVDAEDPEVPARPVVSNEPKVKKTRHGGPRHGITLVPLGPGHGFTTEYASSWDDDSDDSDADNSSDSDSSRDTNQVLESLHPPPRRRDHIDGRLARWRAGAEETVLHGEARRCRHEPPMFGEGGHERWMRAEYGYDTDDVNNVGHRSSLSAGDTGSDNEYRLPAEPGFERLRFKYTGSNPEFSESEEEEEESPAPEDADEEG
ncbi:hypothetical protein PG996_013685 [Apiospora saccharicola]|uniref:Uncharacterized protein n=1 Tax=Apiospora saccharicola TaxID=335842 RepID=A0ABR1U658_9PEZI